MGGTIGILTGGIDGVNISDQKAALKTYSLMRMILLYPCVTQAFTEFITIEHNEKYLNFYMAVERLYESLYDYDPEEVEAHLYNGFQTVVAEYGLASAPQYIKFVDNNELNAMMQILHRSLKRPEHAIVVETLDKAYIIVASELDTFLKKFSTSEQFFHYTKGPVSDKPKTPLLLVEKDVILAKILTRELHSLNYEVDCELKGANVSAHLMSKVYDTVVISLEMSDKNGAAIVRDFLRTEDMCKSRLENYRRPFLMATSVKKDENTLQSAKQSGFDVVLGKPFSLLQYRRARDPNSEKVGSLRIAGASVRRSLMGSPIDTSSVL